MASHGGANNIVQTIDKWLEQNPALDVAYREVARLKHQDRDWFMVESLGRKGLKLIKTATGGITAIRADLAETTANLLFIYYRRSERCMVLLVYVGPNASSLEAARASVTAHTLTAALPNESVIYVRSFEDVTDDRIRRALDGSMPSSPGVLTRASSRHQRRPSVRVVDPEPVLPAAPQPEVTSTAEVLPVARPPTPPASRKASVDALGESLAAASVSNESAPAAPSEPVPTIAPVEIEHVALNDTIQVSVAAATQEVVAEASTPLPSLETTSPSQPRRHPSARRGTSAPLLEMEIAAAEQAISSASPSTATPSTAGAETPVEGGKKKKKSKNLPQIDTFVDRPEGQTEDRRGNMRRRRSTNRLLNPDLALDVDGKPRGSSMSKVDHSRLQETINEIQEFEAQISPSRKTHERSNSERSDTTHIAILDHVARNSGELMFMHGDPIVLLEQLSPSKWRGSCYGIEGIFDPQAVAPKNDITAVHARDSSGASSSSHKRDDSEVAEMAMLLEDDDEEAAIDKESDEWDCFRVDTEVLWLDMAGFSELGVQFESGIEINEEEALKTNSSLNKEQRAALVKRIRFLNEKLREQQQLIRSPIEATAPHAIEQRTKRADRFGTLQPSSPIRPPTGGNNFKTLTNRFRSGDKRRLMSMRKPREVARLTSSLTPQEMEIARKAAFADFTGLIEKRLNMENPFRKVLHMLSRQMDELKGNQKSVGALKSTFGQPLQDLVQATGVRSFWSDGMIPSVIRDLLDFLLRPTSIKAEGLFRVAPKQSRLQSLVEEIDRVGAVDVSTISPHDAACVIKIFFKMLPDPVFTDDLYKYYLAASKMKDRKLQLRALQDLSILLPVANRDLAMTVLKFLNKVSFTLENKMDAHNLAIVLAPSLFRHGQNHHSFSKSIGSQKANKALQQMEDATAVLTLMIEFHSVLFLVPSDIIHQVELRLEDSEEASSHKKSSHVRERSF